MSTWPRVTDPTKVDAILPDGRKASIRRNIYGNWNGYISGRWVKEFGNPSPSRHQDGAEREAREWLVSLAPHARDRVLARPEFPKPMNGELRDDYMNRAMGATEWPRFERLALANKAWAAR